MSTRLSARLAAALSLLLMAGPALSEGKSIIVLDGSGSMWGQIDGRAKLEIAREALAGVLSGIPAETELGFMAYGHREKGSCTDIELIVPPAKGTGGAIAAAANSMKFLGKTPLSAAVRQAAADLRSTEEKATVILITDGIETCEADPCALGTELEASGVDFTAHVVGFGLTRDEGQQVACLATNTGGQYIEAKDTGSLTAALQTAVAPPAPEPEPAPAPQPAALEVNLAPTLLLAPGVPKPEDNSDIIWELAAINADGTTGERIETNYNTWKGFVAPGTYRLTAILGQARQEQDVTVTADKLAAPEFVLNAGRIILHPKPSADGEESRDAPMNYTMVGGIDTTDYGATRVYLPAGDVTVTATMGQASVTETIALAPGQLLERDIIIASGVALVNAFYVEGMMLENTQHSIEIVEAKKAIDGSRNRLTTSYGPNQQFSLAPGDYVAIVSQGAAVSESPFTVKGGEMVEVAVLLNAGVVAISAPGAKEIEVFFAKADINGFRNQAAFDYNETLSTTLPAGDFVAVATRDGTTAEAAFTVKPGERSEIAITLP